MVNSKKNNRNVVIPPPSRNTTPTHNNEAPRSFFNTMKEGFAFGAGSSIAHNIFDSFGSKPTESKVDIKKTGEVDVFKLYNDCLENTLTDNKDVCVKILEHNK